MKSHANNAADQDQARKPGRGQKPDQAGFSSPAPASQDLLWLRGPEPVPRDLNAQRRAVLEGQQILGNGAVQRSIASRQGEEEPESVAPVAPVSGTGTPSEDFAYADGQLTLEGRTDADFDGGSFRTANVVTRPGGGCPDCEGPDCLHVSGNLISTFQVTTSVTLPSADDHPDLTPCQRRRVQDAIRTVLAPHEQEHVQAFRQYNGTVRTPFDMNLCRSDFESEIQALHDGIEETRRDSAQAASDALDPFNFTVDLDCEEEEGS